MKTSVTELPDSRVRVNVDVEPEAVEQGLERAARGLAREMRMPGFRKGKVPPQLVLQRVGREAVLEQALRDSLPEWYERALLESGISPVGDPQLNVPSLPGAGEEARRVAALYPGSTLATGAQATRRALLEAIGSYAVVHIAAHGLVEPSVERSEHPLE